MSNYLHGTHDTYGMPIILSQFQVPSYHRLGIFKALALSADAFLSQFSICVFFVCLFICSLLRYRLNFLPPLPEVGCPELLEIQNFWGKLMERIGLTFKYFTC